LSDHLSSETLSALADGELSGDQLVLVSQHLGGCAECTSSALAQALLKSATARAGLRYVPPSGLRERMVDLASQEAWRLRAAPSGRETRRSPSFRTFGWVAAVALLLVCVSLFMIGRSSRRSPRTLRLRSFPLTGTQSNRGSRERFRSASTFLRAYRQIRRWTGLTSHISAANPRRSCCIALASIMCRCLCNRETALLPRAICLRTIQDFM